MNCKNCKKKLNAVEVLISKHGLCGACVRQLHKEVTK